MLVFIQIISVGNFPVKIPDGIIRAKVQVFVIKLFLHILYRLQRMLFVRVLFEILKQSDGLLRRREVWQIFGVTLFRHFF